MQSVKALIIGCAISVGCVSTPVYSDAPRITLYTYKIPGIIQIENDTPVGLAVDTVKMLFERAGYELEFEIHPFARVKSSVAKYTNSCGFPVNFSENREKRVNYILPLTVVKTEFYSLQPGQHSLEQLKNTRVIALVQHTAIPTLEKMNINMLLVPNAATAINMLQAERAEYIVFDDTMALAASGNSGINLQANYLLTETVTYVICNKSFKGVSQVNLEQTFANILQGGELRSLWEHKQQGKLFDYYFGSRGTRWTELLNTHRIAVQQPNLENDDQIE